MYDIVLVGNIIYDTVYIVDQFPTEGTSNSSRKSYINLGGIENMRKSFRKYDLYIDMFFESTTKATIISNLSNNTRTSIVNWGSCCNVTYICREKTKWCHIAYVDKLNNIKQIITEARKYAGVLSGDFCLNNNSIEGLLNDLPEIKELDYIICAADNFIMDHKVILAMKLGALVKKACILHSPNGSFISNGLWVEQVSTTEIKSGINVLGLGDKFAAAVIKNLLDKEHTQENIKQSVINAHKEVEEICKTSIS